MIPPRTLWKHSTLTATSDSEKIQGGVEIVEKYLTQVGTIDEANLISSELTNRRHAPALDIDFPCQLFESKDDGHFHLYINKQMTWPQYRNLLIALGEAGLLEEGYVNASLKHEKSFLRKPIVKV